MKLPERIIGCTCAYFGMRTDEIMVRTRKREVVYPRQIASYLLRERTFVHLSEMACRLGQKSHANPYYGYKQIKGRIKVGDMAVVKDLKAINAMIDSATPVPSYKSVRIGEADVTVAYDQCGEDITILNFKCDNYIYLLKKLLGSADKITDKLTAAIRNA